MVSSLCKALISIRAASSTLVASKDLNFVQKHLLLVPLSVRYISKTATDKHSFTVSYLINSCGLSPDSALSVSKRVHFETPEKPDSVISLLKTHANPQILTRSLDACIINFNLVKDILKICDDKEVALAFKPFEAVFHSTLQSVLAPNLQLLYEYGVPESNVLFAVVRNCRSLATDRVKFKAVVEKVKNMGFDPLKFSFLDAVQVFLGMSKSLWEKKFSLYKEWGWSDEEIWSTFRKFPSFMLVSEHKLKALIDWYSNVLGWKYQHFVTRPRLVNSSLEKRIIPRCLVLKYLLSKGLIKEELNIPMVLELTENKFLQKFVKPYEDPHLLKLYDEKQGLPN
ncbi:hypothetical protein PTKIN_Ptkin10aG0020600 [Pterospermum kingtungense]